MRTLILGTGTGVGKTYATAAIARALGARGLAVRAVKPIETGIKGPPADDDGPPLGTDAWTLERASFHVTPPRPHPLHRFAPPISAHLAARRAGVALTAASVVKWLQSQPPQRTTIHDVLETAGGVFSPLSIDETNYDLVSAWQPDRLVLVAPDALGVLHDVRATLTAMRTLGRGPDALVLSEAREADASTGTNIDELRALGVRQPIFRIGRSAPADADAIAAWLGEP